MTTLRLILELLTLITLFSIIIEINPIFAVFKLILIYILISALLLTIQTQFFSFILIIVHVGAVAILFIFVIILLELKNYTKKKDTINQAQKELFIFSLFLFLFISFILFYKIMNTSTISYIFLNNINQLSYFTFFENSFLKPTNSDIEAIGSCLYDQNSLIIIYSGLLLLVAIIGAISLVHSNKQKNMINKI